MPAVSWSGASQASLALPWRGSQEDAPKTSTMAASEADATVAALAERRSVIQAGNFRDRHYQLGTILLAVGIPMALEGPVNTYMRAGKLFPGPHVYAGVGVASLWAVAAALVPPITQIRHQSRLQSASEQAATPLGRELAEKLKNVWVSWSICGYRGPIFQCYELWDRLQLWSWTRQELTGVMLHPDFGQR